MRRHTAAVAVIGAGLTGAVAALELAQAGTDVILIDQDQRPINRASLRNEGKVHLGFVFAHDQSLATARLMIEGALTFRSVLSRLTGMAAKTLTASKPFVYLVPQNSLLSPDELEQRFAAIEAAFLHRTTERPGLDYLGTRPDRIVRRGTLTAVSDYLCTDHMAGAFLTEEIAVDTEALARIVRAAIAAQTLIRCLPGHRAVCVQQLDGRFRVDGFADEERWQVEAAQVVNATWENRLILDRSVGIAHSPGWLHRLKYRVIARVPDAMRLGPSVTMVVGPYGDVVQRSDGTAYFSWYPAGLQGWTHDLSPPAAWNAPCRGVITAASAAAMAQAILAGIEPWYPGAAQAEPIEVDAGAIVAYGRTDVDDPASGLHDRTRVGVASHDGYHSVDPGKLTTAPMFGLQAARAVLRRL
jgi:glycine/D-amino acid oxidase-like deaminating enzyme